MKMLTTNYDADELVRKHMSYKVHTKSTSFVLREDIGFTKCMPSEKELHSLLIKLSQTSLFTPSAGEKDMIFF